MELITEVIYERTIRWADRDENTGCLISRYSVGSHGYPQCARTLAHRVVWRYVNGEIPKGMVVDHICRNRRCIEITHLRLLTNYENARRTNGRDWPLGQCVNGHSNDLLYTQPNGKTICRACKQEWSMRYYRKKHPVVQRRRSKQEF